MIAIAATACSPRPQASTDHADDRRLDAALEPPREISSEWPGHYRVKHSYPGDVCGVILLGNGVYRGYTGLGQLNLAVGYCGQPAGVGVSNGTWSLRGDEVLLYPKSESPELRFSFEGARIQPNLDEFDLVTRDAAMPTRRL